MVCFIFCNISTSLNKHTFYGLLSSNEKLLNSKFDKNLILYLTRICFQNYWFAAKKLISDIWNGFFSSLDLFAYYKKNADIARVQCLKIIMYLYSIFEILILISKWTSWTSIEICVLRFAVVLLFEGKFCVGHVRFNSFCLYIVPSFCK